MTFKSYLESGGKECPKCASKAIKESALPKKIASDKIQSSMFCATCSARWQDTYLLARAEDL